MPYYTYKITNLKNSKLYIGKASNIKKRWAAHKTAAKTKQEGDYSIFHRSIAKHGCDNFAIEELSQHELEKDALLQEKIFIKELNAKDKSIGYNLTDGGDGASGYKHTEEAKKRMSELKKGIYLGNKNPFYGKHHSIEFRLKHAQVMKAKYLANKDYYDQLNALQCGLNLEQCLEIQRQWMKKDIGMEALAKNFGATVKTIFNILHGTYTILRGKSLLTEELLQQIKREKEMNAGKRYRKLSEDNELKLVERYQSSTKPSLKELARLYSVSDSTIANILKRHNISTRSNKSKPIK